jgi:CheY-like chemotaxis protein
VDDSIEVLRMLQKGLLLAGYATDVATDGLVALAKVRKDVGNFSVIITDLAMPRLDGVGLIAAAREAGYCGKVIVFAGAVTPDDQQRLQELQVDAVVEKISSMGKLLSVMKTLNPETKT